jgi:hypothetical protein
MFSRHDRWLSRATLGAAALSFFSLTARAGDYYVDAVNGNNANSGATPAQAWRTITRALSALPTTLGPAEVIHVAPGTYDSALGESFPMNLMFYPTVQLVGTGGSAVTFIDGGGTGTILNFIRTLHSGYSDPLTLVQGLTLRNAATGIAMYSSYGPSYVTCRDVKISRCSGWALTAGAGAGNVEGQPVGVFEHVVVSDCRGAISTSAARTTIGHPHVDLTFTDCTITRNSSEGCFISDYLENGSNIVFRRTSITDNGRDGIRTLKSYSGTGAGGTTLVDLSDCLIARNGRGGVKGQYSGFWNFPNQGSFVTTTIRRCTIADNVGVGLDVNLATIDPSNVITTLEDTIVYGNNDDILDHPTQPSITNPIYNDVGDGDFAGSNGNISLNPMFAAPASGDYRLRFGSPCIETGDPATPAGTLDLARNARPIDGDLDTVERYDIGAYEHAPLFLVSTGQLGTPLRLECWGRAGDTTTVSFSRLTPVAPTSTPFGEFDLNPASLGTFFTGAVASGPPVVFARPIANNPSLVGRTFSFQGLTSSIVAPSGFAYTNVVSVTIVP